MYPTQADVVFIQGLRVESVIGVYDWERVITQPLVIDVMIEVDMRAASQSDDVADAINYKAVCDDVRGWCQSLQPLLLERLASELIDNILSAYPCQRVTLKVAKPTAIADADAVGVQISKSA